MVTGLLPVAGVTLPLVSYGGSSLLTLMMTLGLVMNVSIRRFAY
jgi:rod shape determining protein RodA